MTTRITAALLLCVSVGGVSTAQDARQIPLASIYSTSAQNGLKKIPSDVKLGDPGKTIDARPNIFLVAGADLAAAVKASRPHYLDKAKDQKLEALFSPKESLWLGVYFGSTGSQPPQWLFEAVEVKGATIRVTYKTSTAKERTADLRPYLYWAPVGDLKPGEYTLELYDADMKKATMTRKYLVDRDTYFRSSLEVEETLAKWKPAKENEQSPHKDLRLPDTAVVGEWRINRGDLDFSTLTIERIEQDKVAVRLWHGCCVNGYWLKRTGTYADGVLTLDRPVAEYGQTYQRLYAVRTAGRVCLLPDVAVGAVEKSLRDQKDAPFAPSSPEAQYAFQQVRPARTPDR